MLDDNLKAELGSRIHKFDHIAISLMPQNVQKSIFVLYSFFAELDGLAAQVSEPMLGEIRCQWWRDVISQQQAQSPLAEALLTAINAHNWPQQALLDIIEAKIFDLYANPMASTADFEGYAGHTYATLIQLTALAINPQAAKDFADVSGHLGVAFAVAKSVLHLKIHKSRGQVFMPQDIATTQDKATEQDFVNYGLNHYNLAKKHLHKSPVFSAVLPAIRAKLMLTSAQKLAGDLYPKLESIAPKQLKFQWQLLTANITKNI
ncbi:MAG: squalene/phytoene synthase family protein [Rhizobiales bacterium]|nr:squalene/phytoene synthase family protein [Hyphomicrobiales bacterium]NRB12826.1 squalene/phytoene synthase family protein [Hyphomicrobiales bacterium]